MRVFRPWCPLCDATSSPEARRCEQCGLYLYPTRLPNGTPFVPPPVEPDDDDDEFEEAVA
jgi:hypothetical protein